MHVTDSAALLYVYAISGGINYVDNVLPYHRSITAVSWKYHSEFQSIVRKGISQGLQLSHSSFMLWMYMKILSKNQQFYEYILYLFEYKLRPEHPQIVATPGAQRKK